VAYRARVKLKSKKGERELELENFFTRPERGIGHENVLAPDELVAEVRVPGSGMRAHYHKLVEKESFDWPMADVAVVLDVDGRHCKQASIVLGAAAPVPWRAKESEKLLVGKVIDESVAEAAGNAAVRGATPLEKNGYKLRLFQTIVRRTILAAVRGAS
jgi:xanthine dehydrogenase YagS FAD-binding subunit